jgi:predicted amidohydrolase
MGTFAAQAEEVMARFPATRLLIYPELHLCPDADESHMIAETNSIAEAEPLDGPRSKGLATLAGDLGVWLIPGSVLERGEDTHVYNTCPVYSPTGALVAAYRKIFPWRPYEMAHPGKDFIVVDIDGLGRLGLSICYDSWFPEMSRQLAWMGAEAIVNVVLTTTSDRAQEIVLARANAIVNQTYVLSVNSAGPLGTGRSLVVDPEGRIRVESPDASSCVLTDVIDFDDVTRVRAYGTAGLNRMWEQFHADDAPIDLPVYQGRIDAAHWRPRA